MQSSLRKEQYGAVQFLARLGRTPSEAHKLLTTAYQEDALRKAATRTCHKRFKMLRKEVYDSPMRRKLRTKCRRLSRPMSPDNKSKVCITDIKNLEELKNDTPGGINNMEEFESNISGDSRICDEDLQYKSLVCNKECTEDDKTDVLVENLRDDQSLFEENNIQCTQNVTYNDKSNYISNVVNLEKDDTDDTVCITDINNLKEFGKSISGYISNIEKSGKDTLKDNTNLEEIEKYILGENGKSNDNSECKSLSCREEFTEDDKTEFLVENLRDNQNPLEEENNQSSQNIALKENFNHSGDLVNLEKDKDQFKINNFQGIAKQQAMAGPLPSASVLGLTEKTPCFFQ